MRSQGTSMLVGARGMDSGKDSSCRKPWQAGLRMGWCCGRTGVWFQGWRRWCQQRWQAKPVLTLARLGLRWGQSQGRSEAGTASRPDGGAATHVSFHGPAASSTPPPGTRLDASELFRGLLLAARAPPLQRLHHLQRTPTHRENAPQIAAAVCSHGTVRVPPVPVRWTAGPLTAAQARRDAHPVLAASRPCGDVLHRQPNQREHPAHLRRAHDHQAGQSGDQPDQAPVIVQDERDDGHDGLRRGRVGGWAGRIGGCRAAAAARQATRVITAAPRPVTGSPAPAAWACQT